MLNISLAKASSESTALLNYIALQKINSMATYLYLESVIRYFNGSFDYLMQIYIHCYYLTRLYCLYYYCNFYSNLSYNTKKKVSTKINTKQMNIYILTRTTYNNGTIMNTKDR